MNNVKIILASGSPRRRELMDRVKADYIVIPSTKEEKMSDMEPSCLVEGLSAMKASDVEEKVLNDATYEEYCIIGADTVVALDSHILGKPKSREDAAGMLSALSGRSHHVYTGVCIIIKRKGRDKKVINYSVSTEVNIAKLTDEEIEAYINTGEPMDKAGAYAIQGLFAPYVTGLNGDYYNIVGFPISSIYRVLKDNEIELIGK